MPDEEELKHLYEDKTYWEVDYFKHQEGDIAGEEHLKDYEEALEILETHAPAKGALLDVGCAMGVFLNMAQKRGWRPSGVEISSYAVQRAREQYELSITQGTLQNAAFPENHFDVVTLWDVLEHLRDPLACLVEIRRILKPGGLLMTQTLNIDNLLYQIGHWSYRLSFGTIQFPITRLYPSYHLHYFTERTLHRLLTENGFERTACIPKDYPVGRIGVSGWVRFGIALIYLAQSFSGKKVNQWVVAQKVS